MILPEIKIIQTFKMNHEHIETFRGEKSAWNTIVSGTQAQWDLRLNN